MSNNMQRSNYSPDVEDIELATMMGKMGVNCRKITLTYLANKLNMSAPAVSCRIDRMVRSKFIKGFTADINLRMLYPDLTSGMLSVYLKHRSDKNEIHRFMRSCVYVQRSYDGRGSSDYILEVTAPNREIFNDVYHKIGALNSVENVEILATFSGGIDHHNQAELLPAV